MTQKNLSSGAKILIMVALALLVAAAYTIFGLRFSNARLLHYQLAKRIPKLIVIALTAFSIGSASIVFQSVINNTIVTPCLLGMDALYTLVHTLVYFFAGAASILVTNKQISFAVDLVIMAVVSLLIYSYIFKKTGSNVLYVILIGTVLTSFFGSVQSTVTRIMDPNAYETLLTTLVGPLAFLGLIIENLSRQLMQTYRHSLLITASVLFGMIVLLGGQFLVERVFSYNVPVSVFITTGGGIYFLYLLIAKKKPY